MRLLHPTDEEIQAYLDGTLADKIEIERHLRSCDQCRNIVKNYKLIHTHLEQESLPNILSDNAVQTILDTAIKARRKSSPVWETILISMSLIIIVATSFYFFNPKPLLVKLYDIVIAPISGLLSSWSDPLIRTLPVLLVAVIILILFDLADRKFIKSKAISSLLKGK